MNLTLTTLTLYLKAAFPDDIAPLTARPEVLAKMFDVSKDNIRECIRANGIQPLGVGTSGPRYCTLEVWDAVQATKGKEFPQKGGNKRTKPDVPT